MSKLQNPTHPGQVLKELYITPIAMSTIALAKHLGVSRTRIERLVKGKTRMTADTALRLSTAFGTTPAYWMTMQVIYDVATIRDVVDVSDIEPLVEA